MARTSKPQLRELRPGALDLNDLCDIEDAFGPIERVNFTRLSVLRFVLWLNDRKAEPDLTEKECGARYNADTLSETAKALMERSGLVQDPTKAAGATPVAGGTSTGENS